MHPRTQDTAWGHAWDSGLAVRRFLKQNMWFIGLFFVSCCMAFYLCLSQLVIYQDHSATRMANKNIWHYRKTATHPKYFKYILIWYWMPPETFAPFYDGGDGNQAFVASTCSFTECYVTANRNLFGGDLTKFDAILFHGKFMDASDLPRERSRYQRYIFFSMESADNYPVCDDVFDGFFNWTSTYRLDSDIPYPYILIRNNNGTIVGPKRKMIWKEMTTASNNFGQINKKNKVAAWFVSNCEDKSGRKKFVTKLQNALMLPYHLTVDVFGDCGTMMCPKNHQLICNKIIKNEYLFYLSLENSFDEDYVTEKLLTALQNDVVPVVYGGADYTRFLPPGSYIDAKKHNIIDLAAKIHRLIKSPKEYNQYFWWKDYYSFHDPKYVENVCTLCEALHNKEMLYKTRIYYNFRNWWNPNGGCETKKKEEEKEKIEIEKEEIQIKKEERLKEKEERKIFSYNIEQIISST